MPSARAPLPAAFEHHTGFGERHTFDVGARLRPSEGVAAVDRLRSSVRQEVRQIAYSFCDERRDRTAARRDTVMRVIGPSTVLLLLVAHTLVGPQWPQFRGPTGQGHADAHAVPLHWSEEENVRWKVPVEGRGWSSPVVAGGKVWVTTSVEAGESARDRRGVSLRALRSTPPPASAWSTPRCSGSHGLAS